MTRSLWTLLIVAAFTSCATVPSTEQARLEVQQASDQFWAVRDRADAAAFAEQFTEDGIYMVPGLPDSVGRTAIRELAAQRFESSRATEFKVQRREIQVMGDSAHELASFAETYRGQSMRMQGRYFIVWKRGADNIWRVHRYLYSFSGAEEI